VKITGDNQNNIDELYRFINSCNVSVLMNSTQSQSLLIDIGTDDNESNAVNISLNGDTIHISTDGGCGSNRLMMSCRHRNQRVLHQVGQRPDCSWRK
jgi:hypothetical protein